MTHPITNLIEEYCGACCGQGQWDVECCNGSGGCSCRGQPVPMGTCRACGGSGIITAEYDPKANLRAIEGYCYIGTGNGEPNMPAMGKKP